MIINIKTLAVVVLSFLLGSTFSFAQALDDVFNVIPTLPESSSVRDALVSPDGQFVVYIADQDSDGVNELFQVRVSSTTPNNPTKLNGGLVAFGDVSEFYISSDSERVVYRADQDTDSKFELFSVSITGGEVVKLNDEVEDNRDVLQVLLSDDGATVVYLADHIVDNRTELFSVPISGGEVTRLSTNIVANGRLAFGVPQISPDSAFVVYGADTTLNGTDELYSVPIEGGEVLRLNPDPVENGNILSQGLIISPDSSRVVFIGDIEINGVIQVFSVGIRGGGFVNLSPEKIVDFFANPQISPDSTTVIYRENVLVSGSSFRLIKVSINGSSAPIVLSPGIQGLRNPSNHSLSENGEFITFNANFIGDTIADLYVMPLSGESSGQATLIHKDGFSQMFTADSRQIIFVDFTNSSLVIRELSESSSNRVLAEFSADDEIRDLNFSISDDSEFVIFYIENSQNIFAARISTNNDELCFPIHTQNETFSVVCLQ